MPKTFTVPELKLDLVQIRQAYFSKDFLKGWNALSDREKYIWILGALAELEHSLAAVQAQLERVKEAIAQLQSRWED
ncbi:hypothetical protein [Desulfoferrobacter suflitae]|uniref:hypothetical protein n=1 Tax=Desulfoferrobacter suflitae TaxID=2865782 RepID=UPI002164958C|nr:hypothetical protein [Desulfoferrobacter suflitae]MCK8600094.1 hypothetical protein [Desulfoferrobacter suflitae]